jgi:hypothetical protein
MEPKAKKKALEAFVLSENKKEVFESFGNSHFKDALKFGMNTQPYDYYLLLHDINRALGERDKDALKDIEKKLNEMKKRWGEYQQFYKSLLAKYHLARLELEDRQGKKNDILDEINKAYFNFYSDYPEPKKGNNKVSQ